MRIQHNIAALNANRMLATNNSAVSKNLEKLSSGYKINRAGDDAAGLAISEKMRGQIRGLDQASNNASDGISLVQTAEGGLNETASILQRMKELATQASNGTYQNAVDRENISKEVTSLKSEIDRIATSTNFNKINLLDGSLGGNSTTGQIVGTGSIGATVAAAKDVTVTGLPKGVTVEFQTQTGASTYTAASKDGVHVGYDETNKKMTIILDSAYADATSGTTLSYTKEMINQAIAAQSVATPALKDVSVTGIGTGAESVATGATGTAVNKLGSLVMGGTAIPASTKENDVVSTVDTNFKLVATKSGDTGIDHFTFTKGGSTESLTNAAGSVTLNLNDTKDYTADDITKMLKGQGINFEAKFAGSLKGAALVDKFGAATEYDVTGGTGTGSDGLIFQIGASSTEDQQVSLAINDMSTAGLKLTNISVATQNDAKAAIDTIDDAINQVSGTRADLGALQNRLEHTVSNLGVTSENLTSAESRIRDVDMAKEMMEMTKNNVLAQAAQSMLAQANTQPQNVLKLLQ